MVLELLQNTSKQVPPALSLSDDPKLGIDVKSTPVKQKSDVATYRGGDKMIFNIPSDFVDFRHSYLSFTAIIDTPGVASTFDRFSYPIGCIIARARVYMGSKLVEDIDNYGVLRGIFHQAKPSAITVNLEEGSSSNATRAAQSIASRQYLFQLEMQYLEQVIPLHKSGLPLRIELTLADDGAALETDGAGASYQVSNAYYHYRTIDPGDAYEALLDAKINQGGLIIPFRTWSNFAWSNLSGANAQIEIPAKYASCNRFLGVMRNLADIADETVTGKYSAFNSNDVDLLALKVGQRIFPSDKYDLSYDAFKTELMRVFVDVTENRYHGRFRYGDILAALSWGANRCVLPFDLRDDPSTDEDLFGNGINTSASGSSMVLQITLGGAPGSTQQIDTFTEYESAVQFGAGGKITVVS